MIIINKAQKFLDKAQCYFMIKVPNKQVKEGANLDINK